MFNKNKFYLGIAFIVQSVAFLVMFVILCGKKRSIANVILALAAAGGAAGAALLYLDYKDEMKWRKIIASSNIYCDDDLDGYDEYYDCEGLEPEEYYCDGDPSCGGECEKCRADE